MRNDPKRLPSMEVMKDFRIRFDTMVKHDVASMVDWREHPAVLAMVAELKIKDFLELFREVIDNEPEVDMNEFHHRMVQATDLSIDYDTRDAIRRKIRDDLANNIFYGAGNEPHHYYYIYSHRYIGVNLNQPIEIPPGHPSFPLLFSFRFSKTVFPGEFLNYHLNKTYNGEVSEFRLLLTELDKEMLGARNDFLSEWKEINLKNKPGKKAGSPRKQQNKGTELKDYFDNYHELEKLLKNHLFKGDGQLRDNKQLLLCQVGIALRESMEKRIDGKISAEMLANTILNCSFGKELELKFGSIRKSLSPSSLKKKDPSSKLNREVKQFLN